MHWVMVLWQRKESGQTLDLGNGVGGRGLATTMAQNTEKKTFPRIFPLVLQGRQVLDKSIARISLRQPPLSANPFSRLLNEKSRGH